MGDADRQRLEKIWYLNNACGADLPPDWGSVCKKGNGAMENWGGVPSWNAAKVVPHIFLTRAPLTFGHSQLVIPAPGNTPRNEEEYFKWAACLIERAIATFYLAFARRQIQKEDAYSRLAEVTHTKGGYIKTLVLRTSAAEKVGSGYKVHLVPYFDSHRNEAAGRFRSQHKLPSYSTKEGGLLGWLGQREDQVDVWEVDSPWMFEAGPLAEANRQIDELSKELRALWGKAAE